MSLLNYLSTDQYVQSFFVIGCFVIIGANVISLYFIRQKKITFEQEIVRHDWAEKDKFLDLRSKQVSKFGDHN